MSAIYPPNYPDAADPHTPTMDELLPPAREAVSRLGHQGHARSAEAEAPPSRPVKQQALFEVPQRFGTFLVTEAEYPALAAALETGARHPSLDGTEGVALRVVRRRLDLIGPERSEGPLLARRRHVEAGEATPDSGGVAAVGGEGT